MDILTLNCGSSSVKYQLYDWDEKEVLARGIVERVTVGGSFISHYAGGRQTVTIEHDCPNHRVAIDLIIRTLLDTKIGAVKDINEIKAVGHRLVHGGEKITKSVVVDEAALRIFRDVSDLSPLHNPANIMGIEAAREVLPHVPHTVSLDTAWHQTMPARAFVYALPYKWYRDYAVRRYGFHGTSFLYIAKRAAVLLGRNPFECNLICMHIGNGASANAVMKGCSYDTSMGMTPLEGLVMGTRSGDHDPAIDFYIMRKEGVSPDILEATLNKMSGVRGITEKYTDRRDVMKAHNQGDKLATLALEIESYRIRKYIGSYYAALGHVDAVVITAGVGEMNSQIRGAALAGLDELGIRLDPRRNETALTRNAETIISTDDSPVRIFVIPTDEELVMAEDAYALMAGTYDVHTGFTYSFQSPGYVNKERAEALKKDLEAKPGLRDCLAKIPC
jgi:acetate kinase